MHVARTLAVSVEMALVGACGGGPRVAAVPRTVTRAPVTTQGEGLGGPPPPAYRFP